MSSTLAVLAELVGGECVGSADFVVRRAMPVAEAESDDLSFATTDKYLAQLQASRAGAGVVAKGMTLEGRPVIQVADPFAAFIAIVRHFRGAEPAPPIGIHPQAFIDPSAIVGPDAYVGPFSSLGPACVVGARCRIHPGVAVGRDCQLGDDVTLHPHVVLYERSVIGHRVVIHANSVIGADGFGYRFINGVHEKIPQLGHVEIEDDVEIGACTTIDRATFTATRVGAGTKLDNLVQVAHNCTLGKNNILVSQVGMAGSCSTGDGVIIAGQVGIVDSVHVGAGSMIGGRAGVVRNVPPGSRMLGSPATPEREQKKMLISMQYLPELRKEVKELQEKLRQTG